MPHHPTLRLAFEGHPRRVRMVVPGQVEEQPPLLVLLDGQNVLGDHGSHAGGWHAHGAIEKLPKTVRRPVLLAVDHGGPGRLRELWQDLDPFLAFIMKRVVPEAEAHLGLRFDPSRRVIGGASMGGLASLAAIARHPRFFHGALAMSPSAWTVPREIARELRHARLSPESRIYVDVGHRESERMVREARQVACILEERLDDSRLMWRPDRRGKHREPDWKRRLPKALRFLLRR